MGPPLTVPRRFRGPETSGNGGYTAGLLASLLLDGLSAGRGLAVTVRLRTPPPLDRPLDVVIDGSTAVARSGQTVVAEASMSSAPLEPVPPVTYRRAVDASRAYAGHQRHPFPGCVVCGPERLPYDGLRLFAGPTEPGRTACPWRPAESIADASGLVPTELVWAALDCPGGWTADVGGRPMVLGTMTAQLRTLPVVGEECVVTGELRATSERRAETATSVYGADGRLIGSAYAVWVHVDPAAFNRIFAPTG